MPLSLDAIRRSFAVLVACGCREPSAFQTQGREQVVEIWSVMLSDLEDLELQAAVTAYLRGPDSAFWPTPGRLIRLVPRFALRDVDDADNAWADLRRMIGPDANRYVTPDPMSYDPDDPDRNAAIREALAIFGGWHGFCDRQTDNETADRASFRSAYRAARRKQTIRDRQRQALALLDGPRPKAIGSSNGS